MLSRGKVWSLNFLGIFWYFFVYNIHSWICLTFVTCRRKFMKDRAVETKCASASGTSDCSLIDHCLVSIGMPPRPLCPKSFCSDMSRLLVLVSYFGHVRAVYSACSVWWSVIVSTCLELVLHRALHVQFSMPFLAWKFVWTDYNGANITEHNGEKTSLIQHLLAWLPGFTGHPFSRHSLSWHCCRSVLFGLKPLKAGWARYEMPWHAIVLTYG